MKVTTKWLETWVAAGLDAQAIADRLTMAGLEVDSVEAVSAPIKKLVVGEVLSVEPHPNADKLKVCQVNVGRAKPLQIVCGAANVAPGLKVPAATVGCVLPNGMQIKAAELRGIKSSGMLCSASELGLEESSSGLLILDGKLVAGADVYEVLQLDDTVIDIDLTPNRSDCLSIRGVARELSALTGKKLKTPKTSKPKIQSTKVQKVKVSAKKECPRYVGRVVEGIDTGATTPIWMKERLRRCGIRAIHPVVDVTNYVMLELGQPMHGFDMNKLNGAIDVRLSRKGEEITLLDGQKIKTMEKTLVIADSKAPIAVAGIMGGESTAVDSSTTDVFLESAYFSADVIAGRAREYGLHTDSSHRFERGVDPQLQQEAIEYATTLLQAIAGGKAGKLVKVETSERLPKRPLISVSRDAVNDLLGLDIPAARIASYLSRLGMSVSKQGSSAWRVRAPSYRFDINREVDLIEEVARLYGYENLPARSIQGAGEMKAVPDGVLTEMRIKQALVDLGYQEVITYSFVDPRLQHILSPSAKAPRISNPISEDMAVMRSSLLPGLVASARYNLNRQQNRVRIFELGTCFELAGKTVETDWLGGLVTGSVLPEQWSADDREVDFFDLKGDLEALLGLARAKGQINWAPSRNPVLHPGKSADIFLNGSNIGSIGQVNPEIQAKLDLERPVYVFEVLKQALISQNVPQYEQISRYPAIRRDIAIVVDQKIPAEEVVQCVKNHAGELLTDLELFDEYRGEGIDSGRKSLALGLILQDSSRTLKEEVVEALVGNVMQALKQELGAEPRV